MKKRVIKNSQKRLPQGVAALSLALVLLYSQGMTTAAATVDAVQRSGHVCASSLNYIVPVITSSYTHEYQSGIQIDQNGNSSPAFSTCTVCTLEYHAIWKCACGKTNGPHTWTEIKHSSCGK